MFPVNFGMQSFVYAEFLSLAIPKVWAGKADFPSTTELWRRYDEVVKDRGGYGKYFQYLGTDRTRGKRCLIFGSLVEVETFFYRCSAIFPRMAERCCRQIWWEDGEWRFHNPFIIFNMLTRVHCRLD